MQIINKAQVYCGKKQQLFGHRKSNKNALQNKRYMDQFWNWTKYHCCKQLYFC